MYKEIKDFLKQNSVKYRGWRVILTHDSKTPFYLSKFDTTFNEDEFRFFLKEENGLLKIHRVFKVKSYDTPKEFKNKKANVNCLAADEIVNAINEKLSLVLN